MDFLRPVALAFLPSPRYFLQVQFFFFLLPVMDERARSLPSAEGIPA